MPNLRQLEILVAIAETKHFRRAAERAATTQPNVSEQLKALEERLGCQLVERSRSGVLLTPIGEEVTARARRILTEVNDIRTLASRGNEPMAGLVRLGLPPTIGPYLLPHIAPALRKRFPALKLYLQEAMPSELPRLLSEGALDGIITILPLAPSRSNAAQSSNGGKQAFAVESLFEEPLCLAVATDDHLARSDRPLPRSALAQEDVLTLGPGHQLHEAVQQLCKDLGARLRGDFEGTSVDTLREMVIMGLGVTFLPGLYVAREIANDPNLTLLPLEGRPLKREIGLVWRKTSARGPDFEELAAFLKSQVQSSALLDTTHL